MCSVLTVRSCFVFKRKSFFLASTVLFVLLTVHTHFCCCSTTSLCGPRRAAAASQETTKVYKARDSVERTTAVSTVCLSVKCHHCAKSTSSMAPISSSSNDHQIPKLVINLKKGSVRMVHQSTTGTSPPASNQLSPSKSSSCSSIRKHKKSSKKTALLQKALKNSMIKSYQQQKRSPSSSKPQSSQSSDYHQEKDQERKNEEEKENQQKQQQQPPPQRVNKGSETDARFEDALSFIQLVRQTFTAKPIMFSAFMQIIKGLYLNPDKSKAAIRETQARLLRHFEKYPQLAEQFRRQFNVPADLAPAALP